LDNFHDGDTFNVGVNLKLSELQGIKHECGRGSKKHTEMYNIAILDEKYKDVPLNVKVMVRLFGFDAVEYNFYEGKIARHLMYRLVEAITEKGHNIYISHLQKAD